MSTYFSDRHSTYCDGRAHRNGTVMRLDWQRALADTAAPLAAQQICNRAKKKQRIDVEIDKI